MLLYLVVLSYKPQWPLPALPWIPVVPFKGLMKFILRLPKILPTGIGKIGKTRFSLQTLCGSWRRRPAWPFWFMLADSIGQLMLLRNWPISRNRGILNPKRAPFWFILADSIGQLMWTQFRRNRGIVNHKRALPMRIVGTPWIPTIPLKP